MYETQEKIPVRDWITIGVVFLILIVVIFLGVNFAENSNSSTQVISGQLITVTVEGTPLPKNAQKNTDLSQNGTQQDEQQGGKGATAKDQKNLNQMSFFQTFLLLLLVATVFTLIVSVLIALLVIQLTRIVRRLQKKDNDQTSGQ
jgi:CHASE3 domain sensor protein